MSELYNIYREIYNILSVSEKCTLLYDDLIELNKKKFNELEKSIIMLFGFIEENQPYNDALDLFKEIMNNNLLHLCDLLDGFIDFTNHIISKKYFVMLIINRFIRVHYSFDNRVENHDYKFMEWI